MGEGAACEQAAGDGVQGESSEGSTGSVKQQAGSSTGALAGRQLLWQLLLGQHCVAQARVLLPLDDAVSDSAATGSELGSCWYRQVGCADFRCTIAQ